MRATDEVRPVRKSPVRRQRRPVSMMALDDQAVGDLLRRRDGYLRLPRLAPAKRGKQGVATPSPQGAEAGVGAVADPAPGLDELPHSGPRRSRRSICRAKGSAPHLVTPSA